MKRYTLYFSIIVVILIVFNIYFNISIFRNQITFQRGILLGQADASISEIENSLMKFENEVNAILFSNALLNIDIKSDDAKQDGLRSLQMLFNNNATLIKNITIYDSDKNVLNLSFNKKNTLLIDPYITQQQNPLFERESILKEGDVYIHTFPVFDKNHLVANLAFTLDLKGYLISVFNRYYHNDSFWQWAIDSSGSIIFSNAEEDVITDHIGFIKESVNDELSGFSKHDIIISQKSEQLYSAYSPLNILNERFGIVFSMRKSFIFNLILNKVITSGIFSTLIMILFSIMLLSKFGKNILASERSLSELSRLQSVFDNLPVGIMVMDQHMSIKIMNKFAKEMLLMRNDDEINGKNLIDRFMLSKEYYEEDVESAFDMNQFVLYRHEGEEVAVFKKDQPFVINNEEYLLSAFVDVTPVEKARKYEQTANTAKSEFLAKMSHEIRTPMNGIIGMTDALGNETLTPAQNDYVQIIKRSADVLLTLIDDILDFSKIEAGKMQLEEIPFKLREEVKSATDLFKPIIEEKNLKLHLKIEQDVPENIIGDPFRLRQVLSNLISNAVKFTHEGEIVLGISLEESYNHNLTLLFYVEDTGVGIPRNKIESIFNSFTQAEDSTSRKYGGSGLGTTICKQLVTLMHGEMWVQSPSKISTNPDFPGSRFSFTIEVYSNERIHKQLFVEEINEMSKVKSFIIKRKSTNVQRLIRLIEHEAMQYELMEYDQENEKKAIERFKNESNEYHVLFIIDEPGMNGFDLVKQLFENELTKSHLLFLISSNHKSENYIQAKKYEVDFYLTEPFEQTEVVNSLYESFPQIKKSSKEIVTLIKPDLSILIAEDNEINIKVAQTIFSNLGYFVDIAKNGNEAVEMVKSKSYDIIFMDLVMPERDGIQATIEMRGLGYQMPIIAMTATANPKSKSKAIAIGMNDYMTKPVKIDSIRTILLKWFG